MFHRLKVRNHYYILLLQKYLLLLQIYPDLDIGKLEEEIYYDDEIIGYEPEIYFLADNCPEISQPTAFRYMSLYKKCEANYSLMNNLTPKTENYRELPGELLEKFQ